MNLKTVLVAVLLAGLFGFPGALAFIAIYYADIVATIVKSRFPVANPFISHDDVSVQKLRAELQELKEKVNADLLARGSVRGQR